MMARVIVTAPADADTADILTYIAGEAGYIVANQYNIRLERFYERLADHPESCQVYPNLGAHVRVGIVIPYLVIYRYSTHNKTVSIIRILHSRRPITRGSYWVSG